MSNPTIFLSAASDDLREWRDILHRAFPQAEFHVYSQGHSLGVGTGGVPDFDAAEKLINSCGYHGRDEELADAKRVILA